jgi:hypothetical protein
LALASPHDNRSGVVHASKTWDFKTWDFKTWDFKTWDFKTWDFQDLGFFLTRGFGP